MLISFTATNSEVEQYPDHLHLLNHTSQVFFIIHCKLIHILNNTFSYIKSFNYTLLKENENNYTGGWCPLLVDSHVTD